jgi:hypothetical protein
MNEDAIRKIAEKYGFDIEPQTILVSGGTAQLNRNSTDSAKPGITAAADVLRVFGGGRVLPFPEKAEPPVPVVLAVSYPSDYPPPPVEISEGVTIIDPEKFVAETVAELGQHVMAVNAGRNSAIGKYYLIGEKIQALRLCGVAAEIAGDNNVEPELKPLNIDPPDWNFKPNKAPEIKHFKNGLSDSEYTAFCAELGIDPNHDRRRLPANILKWLKRCDAMQKHTRWMREVFSPMAEEDRRRWLDETLPKVDAPLTEPIDWTRNANLPVACTRPLTRKEIKAIVERQGKRGGVFCRSCYRPMNFSVVNAGYDWHCASCETVWRYRYSDGVKAERE